MPMPKTFLEITISLDGFVAAHGVSLEHPLGVGGLRLHDWLLGSPTPADREVADAMFATTGAFVLGRRMFDVGEGPWGADGAFGMPCFVVTHRPRETLVKGPTTFTFVLDGLRSAVEQARAVAGDRDVCVAGGASIARQAIAEGLVHELRVHLAPVLLGGGTRLFEPDGAVPVELERTAVVETPLATHLTYRVAA
jgi:dihydrofolate reductase